jgi:[ribosomal protein S18]-alanine N-acetyltransferase
MPEHYKRDAVEGAGNFWGFPGKAGSGFGIRYSAFGLRLLALPQNPKLKGTTIVHVEIRVREAQASEFDVLWRIDQRCFPPGVAYSRAELAAYMRLRGAFTLVAAGVAQDHQSGVLGFIVARAAGKQAGHIVTIDVLPEARRHAVGSRLLKAAEERLQAAGCRNIFLETAVDNLPAIRFYKKFDYFLVRTLPRYYSNGVDALHLVKELPPPAASG